ncbi:MAG: nucleotide excision repair endonuclease [Verrucomicrobiota bacterium]
MPPRSANRRQPLLIATRSPLSERFGDAFFRALPAGPGVYFFHDAADALLYIGQSGSLRHRVGSYRHVDPDRHPRRLLRLIHRVARIEWRECGSAAEAIALESRLLLEHRPAFNRAGVWPAAVWWLRVRVEEGNLHLHLNQTPDSETADQWHGPLSARQRHAFPAFARCLHRAMYPDAGLWEFPVGLLQNWALRTHSWPMPPGGGEILGKFTHFLVRPTSGFPDYLKALLADGAAVSGNARALRAFWEEQLDEITALVPISPDAPE